MGPDNYPPGAYTTEPPWEEEERTCDARGCRRIATRGECGAILCDLHHYDDVTGEKPPREP